MTKKNVPVVEVQKQNKDEPQTTENVVQPIPNKPKQSLDDSSINGLLKGVSPDKISMAENLGIPLKGIMNWAAGVDEKFKEIETEK